MIRFILKMFFTIMCLMVVFFCYQFLNSKYNIDQKRLPRLIYNFTEIIKNKAIALKNRLLQQDASMNTHYPLIILKDKREKSDSRPMPGIKEKTHKKEDVDNEKTALINERPKNMPDLNDQFNHILDTLSKLNELWDGDK